MNIEDMKMDTHSTEDIHTANRNSNKSFEQRQKDVFDQLNVIQHNLNHSHKQNYTSNERNNKYCNEEKGKKISTKHFRGRESIFKRPEAPISKCLPIRRAPDFQVNPHKWKKYSLDDVKSEDMSERSNQAAAFSFLRELESRKEKGLHEEQNDVDHKIVFKKSVLAKDKHIDKTEKASFKSSKLVMPEYVIGQKKSKEVKKIKSDKTKVINEMKLDHLFEDEDDDGD